MKLYLVRHGLSVGNKKGIHQYPHFQLAKEGVMQAKAIAKRVSKLPIDMIYSSDLKRAQETAEIMTKERSLKIETWEDIRELKRPSLILGKHDKSLESKTYHQALRKNFTNPDWRYSDEESFNELKSRANKVLNHLRQKHENQNVLLVSHGTFIKMLISFMIFGDRLTPEIFWDFRNHSYAENTGISVCEYTKTRGWKLLTFSDSSHL